MNNIPILQQLLPFIQFANIIFPIQHAHQRTQEEPRLDVSHIQHHPIDPFELGGSIDPYLLVPIGSVIALAVDPEHLLQDIAQGGDLGVLAEL